MMFNTSKEQKKLRAHPYILSPTGCDLYSQSIKILKGTIHCSRLDTTGQSRYGGQLNMEKFSTEKFEQIFQHNAIQGYEIKTV